MNQSQEIEKLYEQFRKPLLRYISYKVSDAYTVEEILNDVFFKASKSLDTLKEQTKVQSWLYKIASNLIIDYYRKRKDTYTEINEEIHFGEDENEEMVINELGCCVEGFMKQLPEQYSDSLKAVYLNEMTQKEYAQQNDLNLSTVKSQVKRGRESLKEFFEECCTFEKNHLNNITGYVENKSACKKC